MRFKHNKKRNTAFLYEALVRELTKCIVHKDDKKKNIVISIMKEFFNKNNILADELNLYKTLYSTSDVTAKMAEKLVQEVRRGYDVLDKEKIFKTQSNMIKEVNKKLSKDVFSNFVPNYKNIASVHQFLNYEMSPKKRILLESIIVNNITLKDSDRESKIPGDSLVFKDFTKKFNMKYSDELLSEQKQLLSKYITSFTDNGLELKVFINEEITRLKDILQNTIQKEETVDTNIRKRLSEVLLAINEFKNKPADLGLIQDIIKIQNLTNEVENYGN